MDLEQLKQINSIFLQRLKGIEKPVPEIPQDPFKCPKQDLFERYLPRLMATDCEPYKKAKDFLTRVCFVYRVSEEYLLSRRRDNPRIVEARRSALYGIDQLVSWSLPKMGRFLNRDHSTIIAALKKIEQLKEDGQWPPVD